MVQYVDAEAGIAVFRQGRALCIRLSGALDDRMAGRAAHIVRADRTAVRLRLECSALDGVEEAPARLFASAILAWAGAAGGRSAHILNLAETVQRRVAWHPLRAFSDPDEVLFFDPDREPAWVPTPSRH